jgi:hypothetical protein
MSDPSAIRTPPTAGGFLALLLRRVGTVPVVLLGFGIIVTVIFGELPGEGRYSAVLQDGCHAPAFAALASIMFTLLSRSGTLNAAAGSGQQRSIARLALIQAIAVIVAMLSLGAATEILQGALGRDEEVDDVISDVVGASGVAALWLYATLRGNSRASARLARIATLLACAALAGFWAAPLARCGLAYWARDAQFPVLAQFRSQRDTYFVSGDPAPPSIVRIQQRLAAENPSAGALRVALDAGRWPGMTLTEPVPDWRGFRELSLDLGNPGMAALPLRLRVNDRAHNGAFDDRFNTEILMAPLARTTFHFPLDRIANSPRMRRMDMSRMAQLILFRDGSAPGQAVLIYRIWLQ